MKNSKRNIYILEILILVYLLLVQFLIIRPLKSFIYLNYIIMLVWLALCIIIFLINGFPKDNNYLKKIGIRYAIIYCLAYAMIIYIIGLFTGFSRSIYSHTIKGLFNNIFPVLIMLISREIIRYIICKKTSNNIKSTLFISLIYIIYDLLTLFNYYDLNNVERIFIFLCLEVCPLIAKQSLFTYITYNISFVPTLILAIVLDVFWYIVPIYPDLGNYITSVLGILMPYFLYRKIYKLIRYGDKQDLNNGKIINVFLIPIITTIIVIFVLVAGIGKYKMIAIASDSMNPIYYRGDAIIYEKIDTFSIKKNDILVFARDNVVVTHRVVNIIKIGNKSYFRTKGDNNQNDDIDLVKDSEVLGKVKYIVKYIGYPTVLLQEMFEE